MFLEYSKGTKIISEQRFIRNVNEYPFLNYLSKGDMSMLSIHGWNTEMAKYFADTYWHKGGDYSDWVMLMRRRDSRLKVKQIICENLEEGLDRAKSIDSWKYLMWLDTDGYYPGQIYYVMDLRIDGIRSPWRSDKFLTMSRGGENMSYYLPGKYGTIMNYKTPLISTMYLIEEMDNDPEVKSEYAIEILRKLNEWHGDHKDKWGLFHSCVRKLIDNGSYDDAWYWLIKILNGKDSRGNSFNWIGRLNDGTVKKDFIDMTDKCWKDVGEYQIVFDKEQVIDDEKYYLVLIEDEIWSVESVCINRVIVRPRSGFPVENENIRFI